jgi:hypothetical protein
MRILGIALAQYPSMTNEAMRKQLILAASVAMHAYPQYRGRFQAYRLCRVKRDVVTKAGLAFQAGELAIVSPQRTDLGSCLVWSARNRIDTAVSAADVEAL